MAIDFKGFRQRFGFTQEQMAMNLGIKSSLYAMLERNDRKPSIQVQESFEKFESQFMAVFNPSALRNVVESPEVIDLLQKAQLTKGSVAEHVAQCVAEINAIQARLRKMKRKFDKKLQYVRIADAQLSGITDKTSEMYIVLNHKRNKAMGILQEIVAQNPARLMVKIEVLKEEQVIFKNALNDISLEWLSPEQSSLLNNL